MSTTFWADPNSDPKRNFKYLMYIGGIPSWLIKKTNKPTTNVGEAEHAYINTTFYFPGRVKFEPITVELVDPIAPDASKTLQGILKASGYNFPLTPNDVTTISKSRAVAALGQVKIEQIDSDGNPVEEWTLLNAWIKSIKYGELDYANDELTTLTLEIRYDYAEINVGVGGPAIEPATV